MKVQVQAVKVQQQQVAPAQPSKCYVNTVTMNTTTQHQCKPPALLIGHAQVQHAM